METKKILIHNIAKLYKEIAQHKPKGKEKLTAFILDEKEKSFLEGLKTENRKTPKKRD